MESTAKKLHMPIIMMVALFFMISFVTVLPGTIQYHH